MPTPKKGPRFGRDPAHQRLMMANLAASLFAAGAITTTEAKAKVLRPYAEKLITKAKKAQDGPMRVHRIRQIQGYLGDREMTHKLVNDVAPRYSDRNGGYTRILKLGARQGDAAEMARIELV
ncbi:MAG: 50S ribosomal protein L17 [Actinomycetota bacterium]|nr:50S ribosomal protein L17 [Actinomycetota bacterium]